MPSAGNSSWPGVSSQQHLSPWPCGDVDKSQTLCLELYVANVRPLALHIFMVHIQELKILVMIEDTSV